MGDFVPSEGYKDIKGHQCGALVAVEPVGKDKSGHYMWRCVCQKCGRSKVVNYVQFAKGKMKDCGCTPARGYDLTGKEIGALTVIEPAGLDSGKRRIWLVRCAMCRKKSTMTARKLVHGEPKCPYCGA